MMRARSLMLLLFVLSSVCGLAQDEPAVPRAGNPHGEMDLDGLLGGDDDELDLDSLEGDDEELDLDSLEGGDEELELDTLEGDEEELE